MKALMYHYVRPEPGGLHHYRYLHDTDFRRQLDHLSKTCGMLSRRDFENAIESGTPASGAVLTFDDGFVDHYKHVVPALLERDSWGIFYIPTGTYLRGKLLDVHRVHVLLGHFGGAKCVEMLMGIVREEMFSDKHVHAFRHKTYAHQKNNDEETVYFKRMLNYYISYEWRDHVMDELMKKFLDGEHEMRLFERFYLSLEQIREMARVGMVIGSHTVNHLVMSKLSVERQRQEIEESCAFLADVQGAPVETFCYPYGGDHTFTDETEKLLTDNGIRYSFSVESRDITQDDIVRRPQGLPRYNCTDFPHGQATAGHKIEAPKEVSVQSSAAESTVPINPG